MPVNGERWPSEFAFWAVFALFLVLRFLNPDSWHPVWGGEKPMEFAHINALLRAPTFPPFDPWFSGGILNYYYYGEYLVAFLIKLTGVPSEYAFNLAQPTFMGLAASAMYSLVGAVTSRLSRDRVDPLVGGAVGVLLFCVMGNLDAAWRLIEGFPDAPVFSFDWTWSASRAVDGGITEFPYFTGLYGDLHAHLIALPITLAVLGLGFSLATSGASTRRAVLTLFGLALAIGSISAANAWDVPVYAVVMVAPVFLWSRQFGGFFVRLFVTFVAAGSTGLVAYLLFRPFHQNFVALFNDVGRVTHGTGIGQFLLHFGGLLAILGVALAASGLLSWSRPKPLWRDVSLAVCGIAIAAGVGWQIVRPELASFEAGVTATILLALLAAGSLALVAVRARADTFNVAVSMVIVGVGAAYLAGLGWPVLVLGGILAITGAVIYFSFDDASASFFGMTIAAAGSIVAGAEIFFVVDDLATLPDWYRMNTIFKLYYQVWTLLALAAAVALTILIARRRSIVTSWTFTGEDFAESIESGATSDSNARRGAIAICVVLIALGLAYPAVATIPRIEQRFEGHPSPTTLDALDWMRYGTIAGFENQQISFEDDLAAIEWFQDNVSGTPVIAEASIGPYRGNGSRFSIALGLPAMLGWDRHERQQRYYPEIAQRNADVRALYDSTDIERKRQIIATYGIEYIIVGDVERYSADPENPGRPYASAEGIQAFESMLGVDLEIVFEQNGTVVYRVIR
ncbi:MAG: DUF2298 domain-containing protein [Thermomicrobiales bacterium]|nr:DUF2298 domain-containing protein [Thermomicrobiales bacterium]